TTRGLSTDSREWSSIPVINRLTSGWPRRMTLWDSTKKRRRCINVGQKFPACLEVEKRFWCEQTCFAKRSYRQEKCSAISNSGQLEERPSRRSSDGPTRRLAIAMKRCNG